FVGLAGIDHQPSAYIPCGRQIWIEDERTIEKDDAFVELEREIGEGKTAPTERRRIVVTQFQSASGQAGALRRLSFAVRHPTIRLASYENPSRPTVGHGKVGIELDRSVE